MAFIHHNLMNPLLWINMLYMCFFAYMILCLLKFVLIFWFMFWPIVRLESSFYHGSFHAMTMSITWLNNPKGYCECTKDHLDNPLLCSFTKHMCLWSLQKLNTPLFLFPFFHDFFPSSPPLLFPLSHGFSFKITKLL